MSLRGVIINGNLTGSMPVLLRTGATHVTGALTISIFNATQTTPPVFTQFFDAATSQAVTIGTTIPDWVIFTSTNSVSGPNAWPANGIQFGSGVVVSCTTTPTGNVESKAHVKIVCDG